tara:strand:+ start:4700 stop:4801 length:102 start_codon:yes stop_codon:yes gene_type:complete
MNSIDKFPVKAKHRPSQEEPVWHQEKIINLRKN